ncbi:DUF6479 family protein [Streptomyces sp. NPDC041068]|uniref:DUF6479 family protein n=1 Tax=Streptomyces sp. NPDC041068 TaxID=3155130 RepID=UPI0034019D17
MTDLSTGEAGEMAASVPLGGLAPFLAGLGVAALLVWAVWLGIRVRRREPRPPKPQEQPRMPPGGPVGDVVENREPDEVPRDGGRLTPHRLKGSSHVRSRRK